jgi:uncharacterized membrane protein
MQSFGFRTAALMASVIIFGTMFGGGIYAAAVYFPAYLSDLPNSAVVVTGKYGLHEGFFWVPIHLLAILSLIIALATNWKTARRRPLLIGAGLYVLTMVVTQLYFLPELSNFARSASSNISAADWLVRTRRWQLWNVVRGIVLFVMLVQFLLALSRSAEAVSRDSGRE